ncbi:hypothetical protein DB30_04429 [Enhygromyxa salina]|uniref:Uncharacterized protein n=1 Tax=Enhygromyxa salina TaxID=215803 RepID=A0A0C2CZV9_9BACT|nr:hypothetical protein [Enhygromyxa salina]KIG16516.1 hypothetical protein DB30_04429 [Enhygromyxa salina]
MFGPHIRSLRLARGYTGKQLDQRVRQRPHFERGAVDSDNAIDPPSNPQVELLEKLINDEIKSQGDRNVVQRRDSVGL